jgi:hypothetical protein
MVPPFDIFRMSSTYVLWREAAATAEIAQERIQELALSSLREYLTFNQHTGQPIPVNRLSSQDEYPIAKRIPRRDKGCPEQHLVKGRAQ